MGLKYDQAPQFGDFDELKKKFSDIFLQKTQKEWCEIFDATDACVAPVLDLNEAPKHPHNIAQKTFIKTDSDEYYPNTSPVLSRTPGTSKAIERAPNCGEHTQMILSELGYTSEQIENLKKEGAIKIFVPSKL